MEKNQIFQMLEKIVNPNNILVNEEMKKHTSFKIGGIADFFIKAENIEEITNILKFTKQNDIPLTIVGNGSNLLVKDNGIRGIVLKINLNNIQIQTNQKIGLIEKVAEDEEEYTDEIMITVGAGVSLGLLAQKFMQQSISGFEFASGIPGTIGGAINMNAGAYGREFKDIVVQTKYMDEFGNIKIINNQQHEFEYRNSIFRNKNYIILESVLLLKQLKDNDVIKEKMEDLLNQRKEKQPSEPSAGSTFKRGNDFVTAKLIDECGLKGFAIGDAQISEKHAGFVVNKGNATANEVMSLIDYVKQKVDEKFNKQIELEVEIVGE